MNKERRLASDIIKNKDQYFCWASRPATMQRISLLSVAWYKYFGTKVINLRGAGEDTSYYFERDKYERMGLNLKRLINSRFFIRKHLRNYRQASRKLLAVGRQALKTKIRHSSLLALFIRYQKALIDYAPYFVSTFSVDDYVFPALTLDLKRHIQPDKYDDMLKIISRPTILFGYQKYQQALVKAKSPTDFARLIKKFRWIKEYSFQERLLDLSAAKEDRKHLLQEGLSKDVLRAPAICRRSRNQLTAVLKTVRDTKLKMKIRFVNNYINIKTQRIENYKIFQTDFRNFFEKLLALMKINEPRANYEDMISLTDKEILAYLRNGRLPDLRAARKRFLRQYVSFSVKDHMEFIYDKKIISQIRRAFLSTRSVKEIRGNIVSRGKTRGRVKLVINKSDLARVKNGHILVSNFTTPEYIPAMKKAAAIITDDGGITCHAAIVARELSKPCVVGTKNATRLLEDGDLVEVDASQGIVRIIKKGNR